MLLLTVLFTVVLCLFLYSLRTDKGKHTKYARADYRSTSRAVHQNKTLKSSAENSTPSAA